MKISVIIPAYNEVKTIREIINRVNNVEVEKEIIIVDDASTDGTKEIIESLEQENIKKIFHRENQGKGAAIKSALALLDSDITIIQDADLEYCPDDYPRLINHIARFEADVVFGSRFIGEHRCFLFAHYMGNKIINFIANILFNANLSDFMTGYKAFKTAELKKIKLESKRFGFEAEITGEVFRRNLKVYEVPIAYSGRNYSEGKKIRWNDFFVVLGWLVLTKFKRV